MSVQIIVDSTVDMPERMKDRFRIVPLTVHFGAEEFIDGVTIDKHRFYERLVESDELPTTSQASPAAFDAIFSDVASVGDSAVVVTLASKFSGTYQSACIAAAEYDNIYELEKRVMHGELKVHDLPGEWNRLYKEYLGVDVPDDKHGVLQDSHWSGGSIGYFPSYALGSAYGAQLLRKMKETVDVDECLKTGNFAPINAWNREHIWQYGCLKKPGALLEQALGEKFDPTVYTQYLEEKYGEIYGL